ncbi:unnamed protein product [Staurois parvus]|uniref:Uncharacterized protein n=1 Tax=Staurois parvus TaxID=386267 RepID=A0ABN9BH75_9NEOB|nr:unnamed protein product [Staurois parvus]
MTLLYPDSTDCPCADYIHPPKKKKKLSSNTYQTEHVQLVSNVLFDQQMDWGLWKKRRIREDRIKLFYTMQRINPLGFTASITSMLCCIYRLILLLWV